MIDETHILPEEPPDDVSPTNGQESIFRLSALLLGLTVVTGTAAMVVATGGGMAWGLSVFGILLAVFVNGFVAGGGVK